MSRIAWFDCSSGVSGDMMLAALVDAGAPLEVLQAAVSAACPKPVRLRVEEVSRAGLRASRVHVEGVADAPSVLRRTWSDVRALLSSANLPDRIRRDAHAVFLRLAAAEGRVHGVAPEQVHFHEVGALDAIADVVGVCAGLAALDVDAVTAGPVAVGAGTARSTHGDLPVPVPAVVELLKGAPTHGIDDPRVGELTTPTGAAILAALCTRWTVGQVPLRTESYGVGAGGRDLAGRANVLRVLVGEEVLATEDLTPPDQPGHQPDRPLVIEANVDDLDPRLWPPVLTRLLASGASDAWLTPILMKKGRPAHTLSVLVAAERADAVRRVIFTETTTLGLREHPVGKIALDRELRTLDVEGEPVRVKVGLLDARVITVQPEYDDVVAAAERLGRPAKAVLAAAQAAWQRLQG